jgi:hypothetical protein
MSHEDVQVFFEEYIFGYIFADIQKQIDLARSELTVTYPDFFSSVIMPEIDPNTLQLARQGGGNFLCALGLLCYTEFMGGLVKGGFSKGSARSRFNAFFYRMGQQYTLFDQELKQKTGSDVYSVFRCGMAHEYFVKKSSIIFMLSGGVNRNITVDGEKLSMFVAPSMWIGPSDSGIGYLDNGKYFLVVEQYFKDFAQTCQSIYQDIMKSPNPSIPND